MKNLLDTCLLASLVTSSKILSLTCVLIPVGLEVCVMTKIKVYEKATVWKRLEKQMEEMSFEVPNDDRICISFFFF